VTTGAAVPQPAALRAGVSRWLIPIGLGAVSVAAALLIPLLSHGVASDTDQQRRATQFALLGTVVIACTAVYLFLVARATPLGWPWFAWMLGYNTLIAVTKFVLSPNAYLATPGTTVGQFVRIGVVVMVFYLLALIAITVVALASVRRGGRMSWLSRGGMLVVTGVIAAAARFIAVPIVGAPASQYLSHVFAGTGLILPAVLLLMGIALTQAFAVSVSVSARASFPGVTSTAGMAAVLVVAYHIVWILFMVRAY